MVTPLKIWVVGMERSILPETKLPLVDNPPALKVAPLKVKLDALESRMIFRNGVVRPTVPPTDTSPAAAAKCKSLPPLTA